MDMGQEQTLMVPVDRIHSLLPLQIIELEFQGNTMQALQTSSKYYASCVDYLRFVLSDLSLRSV
jgi:hypothetical protein